MASVIRHHSGTHAEAGDALTKFYNALDQLETDLNTTANKLVQPDVWAGAGAQNFFAKHGILMRDVTALKSAVKALNAARHGAHEDILGANDHVRRVFET
ncbi:uncharacterized protein YukE [Nocardia sp. GAS34]|uniref:hypothetical protein n=1 Tax=unclassified Nocardia TaxID=2637762 RepID=UPI003D2454EC